MPRAQTNGIELEYEVVGDPAARPLLLVQGLGAQLISVEDRFCAELAARGFMVIRFDNRDVGLSTRLDGAGAPDFAAIWEGDHSSLAYTLDDMADDAAGLLDAAGVRRAHVAGVSLGGMIAQLLAIRHPEKVLSLASIMSTTGDRQVGQPSAEGAGVLFTPMPAERECYLEQAVANAKLALAGSAFSFDPDAVRRAAARGYDRAHYPDGVGRQLAAALAATDRTEALRSLRVPTLVVHGDVDRLVGVSGGEA
ncbi:MAG TPA: alpha/beta hydrolase, partial [Actinomycetota bacterium]|nr:alpha/beta hydrolase [Actinomycetota bacterium]